MTVSVTDVHGRVQGLISVVKMATVLPKNSVIFYDFLWAKGLNAKDIINKYFMFTVGSVCRVKRFTAGSKNSLKDVLK
jgi:hypothetical protein